MTRLQKWAMLCHSIAMLLLAGFGVIYLFKTEFMPYHAIAVGRSWAEIDAGLQLLLLALMKVAGGGWLATAIAIGVLLAWPFRAGLRWSYWAIPAIGLVAALSSLFVTIYMANHSPANPPWFAAAIGVCCLCAGLILSLNSKSPQ